MKNISTDASVRQAKKSDMTSVHALISELAHYERAPEEVVVTISDLKKDGFGAHPKFYCFVAEKQNKIVGMALYYIKYSTWKGPCIFLEDIIVTEKERKNGIGKLLFEEVVRTTKKMGARRMEWQVLDWNKPAIKFYEKYNPQILNEWMNYRLTEKEMIG